MRLSYIIVIIIMLSLLLLNKSCTKGLLDLQDLHPANKFIGTWMTFEWNPYDVSLRLVCLEFSDAGRYRMWLCRFNNDNPVGSEDWSLVWKATNDTLYLERSGELTPFWYRFESDDKFNMQSLYYDLLGTLCTFYKVDSVTCVL